MRTHTNADHRDFGNIAYLKELSSGLVGERFSHGFFGAKDILSRYGECHIRLTIAAKVLYDHIDTDTRCAEHLKELGGCTGAVWQIADHDLSLVFIECDAADDDIFHGGGFFFHNGTWVVVETGTDFKNDVELLRKFDGAVLHYFGTRTGELEHLLIGDLIELLGIKH